LTQNTAPTPKDLFVEVGGIRLRYADWGDNGPPVLLLHGDMRTSRSWDAVARDLHSRFRVISLDSRGHGDSDWPEKGYRYTDRINEVGEFCEAIGFRGGIGVGHSSGASVIALAAERNPHQFSRLALLEPPIVIDETFQERVSRRYNWTRSTWASKEELREVLKKHELAGKWRDDVIEDVVNHEATELPDGRIDMKWSIETMNWNERKNDYFDLKPVLRKLGIPIAIITSSERAGNYEAVKTFTSELDDFQIVTIENTGHNMYMERPDATASAIRAFAEAKPLARSF
jgi:pimeloyl-ACP methyl ester carboxylesterase